MNQQPDPILRIYLHELAEKDAAVITRVVNFSSSQGKPYALHNNPAESHILVVTGNTAVSTQNPIPIIRIHHQVLQPNELLLAPPLLVTRVMRIIDEAAQQLLVDTKVPTVAPTPLAVPLPTTPVVPSHSTAATNASSTTDKPIDALATKTSIPESTQTTSTPISPVEQEKPSKPTPLALIIDDSLAIRTQLALELRQMNIACEQAETGEQGLELLVQGHYHMIFLDIILPGMDGYEVCKQIRSRPATRKTPVIMLSGKDTPLDEVKGILAGATTYLTKPVNSERLQQTISRIARWIAEFS